MVTGILILVALSWALWLFSNTFRSNNGRWLFISFALISVISGYGLYQYLGASKVINQLAKQHQSLKDYDLTKLAAMVGEKKLTVNQLISELRLRQEANPSDKEGWMKLGRLMLVSSNSNGNNGLSDEETKSLIKMTSQAFDRASQIGTQQEQINNRIEVAKTYIEFNDFESALSQLNLVLLKNTNHEGALMMKGLTDSRLGNHQAAIDTWSYLLAKRESGSDSANLIDSLIAKEKANLDFLSSQYVSIHIDNFSNLDLHSFTKAFALIRPAQGGAPIAVKSYEVHKLPNSFKLTPNDLMLQSNDFWQATDLYIEVRLSQSGFAKSEIGDKYGRTKIIKGLKPEQNFHINIDKVVN